MNRIRKRYRRTGLFKDMPRSWQGYNEGWSSLHNHGIYLDLSNCEDRSGLHWVNLEWPTLHKRSPYATETEWPGLQFLCRFIMYRASLGEVFLNVLSKTAHCKIFSCSWEKNGPKFYIRLSGHSSTRPRIEPVNAGVITVVSHIIDFWDTFWITSVGISGFCHDRSLVTLKNWIIFILIRNRMHKGVEFVVLCLAVK